MSKNPRHLADKKSSKFPKAKVNNNISANDRKRNFITKLNQVTSVPNAETFISQIKNVHYLADINPSLEDDPLMEDLLSSNKTKEDGQNSERILAGKLRLAESQLQNMKTVLTEAEHQITLKNKEIDDLKRQAKIRSGSKQFEKSSRDKIKYQNEAENAKYLHRKCNKLEKKVKDMESFLRDYGLIWVGHNYDDQTTQSRMTENYIEEYFEQLMLNISQLNAAAGKDEVVIERSEKGASFKSPTCVSLKFYKNGLVVQNGPLRRYQEPSTESFIRDILDGYFPSELQKEYPNGVPFKVEDRRIESFFGKGFEFAGQGHKLKMMRNKKASDSSRTIFDNQDNTASKASTSNCIKPVKSNSKDWNVLARMIPFSNSSCSDAHMRSHIKVEMNTYLSKDTSSKNITRKSSDKDNTSKVNSRNTSRHSSLDRSYFKICSNSTSQFRVRSRSVNSLSHGYHPISPSGNHIIPSKSSTSSARSGHERNNNNRKASPLVVYINEPSGKDGEFRLKIRSVNGCILYLVHVTADDTVNELYTQMNKTMPKDQRTKYKIIMSGLGLNILEERRCTLGQYGISKDCVLHLSSD